MTVSSAPRLLLLLLLAGAAFGAEQITADEFVERVGAVCLEGASLSVSEPVVELSAAVATLTAAQTALPVAVQQLREDQQQAAEQVISSQQEAALSLSAGQERIEQRLAALEEAQRAECPLCVAPSGTVDCPAGWTRIGSSCYLVSAEPSAWVTAHARCAERDGRARLASVHADTVRQIQALSRQKLWIGLGQSSASSPWLWADGTPVDYVDWDGDYRQPDNVHGIERCALISSYPSRGWHDYPCDHSYKYVCQIHLQ